MDNKENMIPEESLEGVSGGKVSSWSCSDPFYSSGDTPTYKVGDTIADRFYIKAVNDGKSGVIHKEFTYCVVYADDHSKVVYEKMYESHLMSLEQEALEKSAK